MVRPGKLLDRLRSGDVKNVRFADLLGLCGQLGFAVDRVRGSHHILFHAKTGAMLNLQKGPGGDAKPYQARQVLRLIEQLNLRLEDES